MQMVLLAVFFLLGIFALYIGAEALVRGSVRISHMLGISPIIMGLTVVAFGTSAPEFAVSLVAALQHSRDIAIGNIVGSNIANIGLIIGLSALFQPLTVRKSVLFKEVPILLVATVLVFFFFKNLLLSRMEGFVLLGLMALFLLYMIQSARKEHREREIPLPAEEEIRPYEEQYPVSFLVKIYNRVRYSQSFAVNGIVVLVGILLLTLGSNWLIRAARDMARMIGISDVVIGMSVVAIGTSLPELATSLVSAIKKQADISLGNIIGSNIFNTFFVLGTIGAINPISVEQKVAFYLVPIMILFTVLFVIFMITEKRIVRWEAGVLFVGYIIFLNYIYL